MTSHPPILIYQALMEDIKRRIVCLRRVASGDISLGDDRLNWELSALQLRMVAVTAGTCLGRAGR